MSRLNLNYRSNIDSNARVNWGRYLIIMATAGFAIVAFAQFLNSYQIFKIGFDNFRPLLFAFVLWGLAFGYAQVLIRGEAGKRLLFILPAIMYTVACVIFPTLFGLYIAFSDWNLSSFEKHHFNGFDNIRFLLKDLYFWNSLGNMVWYVLAVFVQYVIAFGLAMLLNAEIRARKFFRVAFLMPFMMSPVAVSWMVGKSLMEYRYGPLATIARFMGWETPAFFATPWVARFSIMGMDAWVSIPFIMILLLAGLQAVPKETLEAAKVDGASIFQAFRKIIFPLMLPVSVTAITLRIIGELKLADIVITMTAGGPGGATDTVSSFIYREYRDRSNVGYATMIAEVYLILVIILVSLMLVGANRILQKYGDTT